MEPGSRDESADRPAGGSGTVWMLGNRVFQLVAGVFVNALVARRLGPGYFGALSYALAFTGFFGIWAGLGIKSIVIRDVIRNPGRKDEILGSASRLQVAAGIAAFAAAAVAGGLAEGFDSTKALLIALCAAPSLLQAFQTQEYWLESKSRFDLVAAISLAMYVVISGAKLAAALLGAPVRVFAVLFPAEAVLTAIALIAAGRASGAGRATWRFDRAVAVGLVREGFPLLLASVAVIVYMQTDQIMLAKMLGDRDVGLYSVAVRVSEATAFVPAILAGVAYPGLVAAQARSEEEYYGKLQDLFDLTALCGLAVAILVSLFARPVVAVLFGPEYAPTAAILAVHAWGGLFAAMGIACRAWFNIAGLQRYTLYRTLAGCVVNVALNVPAILLWGGVGAAATTVLAQAISLFLFNGINPRTRRLFGMQLKSLLPARGIRVIAARVRRR